MQILFSLLFFFACLKGIAELVRRRDLKSLVPGRLSAFCVWKNKSKHWCECKASANPCPTFPILFRKQRRSPSAKMDRSKKPLKGEGRNDACPRDWNRECLLQVDVRERKTQHSRRCPISTVHGPCGGVGELISCQTLFPAYILKLRVFEPSLSIEEPR